jgi:hypothetical protein
MTTQTMGQRRVRADFNPSNDELVAEIKAKTAELIDLCNHQLANKDQRLSALAQTAFEEGAMWAVKAATATA